MPEGSAVAHGKCVQAVRRPVGRCALRKLPTNCPSLGHRPLSAHRAAGDPTGSPIYSLVSQHSEQLQEAGQQLAVQRQKLCLQVCGSPAGGCSVGAPSGWGSAASQAAAGTALSLWPASWAWLLPPTSTAAVCCKCTRNITRRNYPYPLYTRAVRKPGLSPIVPSGCTQYSWRPWRAGRPSSVCRAEWGWPISSGGLWEGHEQRAGARLTVCSSPNIW